MMESATHVVIGPANTDPGGRTRKKTLTLGQLLLLNAIVCGLEFCASAAFTYIPPMLLKAGLSEGHMSTVLGIGPLLGFFIVPVIGRASDKCQSSFGRRRPFILGLSLTLLVSLLVIPYGEFLGIYAFGKDTLGKQFGVALLIIGSVILDFSSQACLTPCEALISDAARGTDQQDICFNVYSFMVSLGGCIGYLITALDWTSSSVGLYFGGQEQTVFSVIIIIFVFTMCATLFVAQETPLQRTTPIHSSSKITTDHEDIEIPLIQGDDIGYETSSDHSTIDEYQNNFNNGFEKDGANSPAHRRVESYNTSPEINGDTEGNEDCPLPPVLIGKQCNVPMTRWSFTNIHGLLHILSLKFYGYLPQTIKSLWSIPFVLKRLAIANFCSWTAIMAFNLFFTDYVGQAVYGGNPNAPDNTHLQDLYDAGVRMGSWGLLLHCITSAIYAAFINRMVARFGSLKTYLFGMFTFALAMTGMMFVRNIFFVTLMAACTGFGFATVTTIPFSLITMYHDNKELFFYDQRGPGGIVQARGIGSDMALLDSAYFLSQVVLSAMMGRLVDFTGTVLTYVICAASLGVVSCFCILRIISEKKQMMALVNNGRIKPCCTES